MIKVGDLVRLDPSRPFVSYMEPLQGRRGRVIGVEFGGIAHVLYDGMSANDILPHRPHRDHFRLDPDDLIVVENLRRTPDNRTVEETATP